MACAQQCAAEYLGNARKDLVTNLQDFPLIIENLYQRSVFNDYEVDALKAERTDFDKARLILDTVYKKGESASYELLRILNISRTKTLHPDSHIWISCFPFREDTEGDCIVGTKPRHNYQMQLKMKAEKILKRHWEQCCKYIKYKPQEDFAFVPVVLDTDTEMNSVQNKIKTKNRKCKKLRHKKLKSYIPVQKQKLTPGDLLSSLRKAVLLIGKPGIGKTSVVLEMLSLWSQKENRELDYMFYFDEATLSQIANPMSLESLLFDLCCKPLEKDRKEVLQDIEENSENVIIVFDGASTLKNNQVLQKIMNNDLLPDAKIVMTCRSDLEDDFFFPDTSLCKVYVQGFSEESVRVYFKQMIGSDPELLSLVLNNQELFSLCHVPMYASMVAACISFRKPTSPRCPLTVTEMYVHILRQDLKKAGNKTSREVDKYIKDMRDELSSLMKSAFNATSQRTVNISSLHCDETEISNVFLKTITTEDSPTSVKQYHAFLHSTVQEFFAALWLLGNPGEIDRVLQLCQTEEQKHLKHVIPFFCGLLSNQNLELLKDLFLEDQIKGASDKFFMKLMDSFFQPPTNTELMDHEDDADAVFLCQCLYESQSLEACLLFMEKVNYHLDLSGNDLDPHQCCAVSYVISQSSEKQVQLSLEDCSISDTGIQVILRITPHLRCKSSTLCHLWMSVLGCERPRDFTALLHSCGKQLHLPVFVEEASVLRKAGLIITEHFEKINLHLHCDEDAQQLSDALCNMIFEALPQINSLRFEFPDDSRKLIETRSQIIESIQRDLVLRGAVFERQQITILPSVLRLFYEDPFQVCDFLLKLPFLVNNVEDFNSLKLAYEFIPSAWYIDLSARKVSIFLEVLKLQKVKKPVELRGLLDEESEVRSFLQCLPYISQLRFTSPESESDKLREKVNLFLLDLCLQAALHYTENIHTAVETLMSCTCETECDFLLDLYSHVKNYETQTGRSVLPVLQPVYQSAPAVWIINLSERKSSLFLEVLKLQTVKKPVELRGWSDEESEVRSFLQCLPYISQLRFRFDADADLQSESSEWRKKVLLDLCLHAVLLQQDNIRTTIEILKSYAYGEKGDFLLDLYSHVKNYETQTGRSVLPALQPVVYQSAPAAWNINLSERKSSLLLEVLKLQTVKKPVELRGWSDEESKVRSFLQCLPYISQLRISSWPVTSKNIQMFLHLLIKAAEFRIQTGEKTLELLTTVCTYRSFPYEYTHSSKQSDFLLDLYMYVKNYETQTGRSVLPALQPVYQSAPAVWDVNLSERKSSLFLEVLKLQTVKKPVELRGWSDEESEVRSFLQCLPYISQLRFSSAQSDSDEWKKRVNSFLQDLCLQAALHLEDGIHTTVEKLIACSCGTEGDFLLDLYSHVKNYESQTGRSVLPVLQPVYQSAPPGWIINLSERKSSLLLEVLKLQTVKKPVELRGWSDEESKVRTFVQCLPYISQLRISSVSIGSDVQMFLHVLIKAAECEIQTGEKILELLTSVCTYSSFPYGVPNSYKQNDFLLDLYSLVKNYDTQSGSRVLPALQPVYQSAPAGWIINLSERKSSLFLEVLKLQTEKKPVELRGWSDEESEVRSFLQCLPYISQLRISSWSDSNDIQIFLHMLIKAAECERQNGEKILELLTSVCTYRSFPYEYAHNSKQSDFLLDLYSHVRGYQTQTGRSVLPALQPVYQSAPAVWIIDLSERKSSLFLEVLKLQTVKKPVELRGWSDEEREVRSFLQCLPYISQLRFCCEEQRSVFQFLVKLIVAAAEGDKATQQSFIKLLTSVCSYRTLLYDEYCYFYNSSHQSDFLLYLYSHVKNYETQTGRSVLPALQPVYQSAPAVWIIDLSERKRSLLLEVLKFQTVKKPVELRGWSDEESEVRSFLQCLPYISQLRLSSGSDISKNVLLFLHVLIEAAECERQTGEKTLQLLISVCTYSSFPYGVTDSSKQSNFLLDLYSHVKNYETQSGRRVLPALQPVYQSVPAVWIINLSERKSSLLLEVLKLQTEKKPVELRGWSDEESEARSFLQCLPYISQLSGAEHSVPSLCKVTHSKKEAEQVALLLQALNFTLALGEKLSITSCRSVGRVLGFSASSLNLTLNPQTISLRGARLLFRHITHLHTLRLNGVMMVRMVRALRAVKAPTPVTIEELTLILNRTQWSVGELSRVLSSLASLLRLWKIQCVNLTEHTMEVQSLTVLLSHRGSVAIRLSKETLQQLAVLVYETKEEEFTLCFLQKVGGDLTSCSLNWEMIQYFLQYHMIIVDFRKSNIKQHNIRELLSVLDRVQFRRLSSSFVLSIIREIYETGSVHCVSSLLSSAENCINLNSRELDFLQCAALRFTLQHCTAVSLSLLWTSIPEGELQSLVLLLNHISNLSVDRLMLLRLLYCCSVSKGTAAAAALLSALQHRLDFSCSSNLDLTVHTHTLTLNCEDCRVISSTIQRAHTNIELILQDCEIEEAGVDQLFTILHTVRLNCSKVLLLQFLTVLHVKTELDCVRHAVALSQALGKEVDLSQTRLDLEACRFLALFLEHSKGLSELDLSHCCLSDHCLELLLPQLRKTHVLDLSNNDITDHGANKAYSVLFSNSNIKTVRLFNNRITQKQLFMSDPRFEIW